MNETITNYEEMSTEKLKRKAETTFNNAQDESDYKKALKMYTELIHHDPTCSEYYYCCGDCYGCIDDLNKAIEAYSKAIELNSSEPAYYSHRGRAYNKTGKYVEAVADYTKAIELAPNADYYFNRGYNYYDLGKYDEAVTDYDKAIELNNNDSAYYNNRGVALEKIGKKSEAIQDYSRAIKLNPNNRGSYRNRARALRSMQKYSEAINDYTQLIYFDSGNPDYYFYRGQCLSEKEKYKEAMVEYNIAIELNPEDPYYYCNNGVALYNLGRFDEAIVNYTKAIEFYPDSDSDLVLFLYDRGNAYRELGQFEKAYADYARGFEITPENSHLYFLRGFAKAAEGDFEAACADTMKAIQLKPDESGYYDALGNVFRKFGRYEDAVNYYTVAIDMDSECYEFYKNRAEAYTALGKIKEAEADNAKAAELKPANVSGTENVKARKTPKPKDINATAAKIIGVLSEKTAKKATAMKFVKQKNLLTGSKLGGVPFIPVGGEYPVNPATGEKLFLLAQINFADVPPLPDYPTEGILQIFISDGDTYGCDFDNCLNKDGWRILYYSDISNPMPRADIVAMMPEYPQEYLELPFINPTDEYRIKFVEKDSLISVSDFKFREKFTELCSGVLPSKLRGKDIDDLPDSIVDDLYDELNDDGSRIGGYPEFAQDDPRGDSVPESYELLVQIGSDNDTKGKQATMWSDCGIANFFIDPEDLKKRDFSKVIYTWEGC